MYVFKGMYGWKHRKPLIEGGAGYFIQDDGHMIPRIDVLIVLSLPPDWNKKYGYGESGAEHFLFYDFVQKIDKLWRYKQKTDFWVLYILILIFQ